MEKIIGTKILYEQMKSKSAGKNEKNEVLDNMTHDKIDEILSELKDKSFNGKPIVIKNNGDWKANDI